MPEKKSPLETDTKKAVQEMLQTVSPVIFQYMPAAGEYGVKGIPDHIACLDVIITPEMVGKTYGMFVAIESKRPDGELHGLQPITIANIVKAHGFAQVCDSKQDAERIRELLIKRFQLDVL